MGIDLTLEPRKLAWALARVILALDAAYILTQALVFAFGFSPNSLAFALVDLNHEMNFPTFYAGAALLLAALLLAATAAGERGRGRPFAAWAGLSSAFVFLAADEVLMIHEKLNDPLRAALHTTGGAFHHAWLIPYAVLTAAMGALYVPFLLRLPKATRRLFIVAGTMFVGGAVGCELIGNALQGGVQEKGLPLIVEIFCEETLEMSGVALFIYAIVAYMQAELPGLSFRVGVSGASSERL